MEYSISINRNINESMLNQKWQEYSHLVQQFKAYKQTYQNRPLLARNIDTYLELTRFISQLAPTFLSHYAGIISKDESITLNNDISALMDDILSKLKNFADRVDKKDSPEINKSLKGGICRVCLRQLRTIEVANAKEQLESQDLLSKSIMKVIKEIEEQSQPFTKEEDRNFFKELKIALDKKQEVIEICSTESEEFTRGVQEQLKHFLELKELLNLEEQSREQSKLIRGNELQENVGNSIKQNINSKLPSIISIVAKSIKGSLERQRRSKRVHIQTQTIDFENSKVLELRRKIAQSEATANLTNQERQKFHWAIHQKEMIVSKMQAQLQSQRIQYNKKEFELHREIKSLQERCKKMKEDFQREKIRSRREISERDFAQTTIKTLKTLHRLKEVTLMQEQEIKQKQKLEEEVAANKEQDRLERQSRRKKTLYNTKGSKFYLPTLTKINKEESQLLSKTELEDEKQKESLLNQTVKTEVASETFEIQKEKEKVKDKLSKTTLQKRGKNEMKKTIDHTPSQFNQSKSLSRSPRDSNTDKIYSKASLLYKKDFKSPANMQLSKQNIIESRKSHEDTQQQLPQVAKQPIKVEAVKTRLNQLSEGPLVNNKNTQKKQVRASVGKEGEVLKDSKARASITSLNSAVSILNNFSCEFKGNQRRERQSILKMASLNQKSLENELIPQTKQDKQKIVGNNSLENLDASTNQPQQAYNSQLNTRIPSGKVYLVNSYSKINQQIDKENYITPAVGVESPGFAFQSQLQKKLSTTIEEHLYRVLKSIDQKSQKILEVTYKEFSELFAQCLSNLSSSSQVVSQPITQKKTNRSVHSDRKQSNSFDKGSIYTKKKMSKLQQIPLNRTDLTANFQYFSRHPTEVVRQSRFSTELVLLRRKMEQEVKREKESSPILQRKTDKESKAYRGMQILKIKPKLESETKRLKRIKYKENSLQLSGNSPQKQVPAMKKIFTQTGNVEPLKLNFDLFLSEEKSFEYESNLSKKVKMVPPSPELQNYLNQLYQKLEQIKYHNKEVYQQICSYLRYPFTNLQQGCFHIDIIQNMSHSSLTQCFQKLMPLHKKCRQDCGLCNHLLSFKARIVGFVQQFSQ